jgi:hypothetical protein
LPEKLRDALGIVGALALGLFAFLVLIGWQTLLPSNIGWLNFADRAMHTLGWMNFRQQPWGMPPGLNPGLGLELANSIALVDGLPLFALPAKLLSAWLPQPFQYWGIWLFLSFLLHALFAYLLARQLGAGRLVAVIAAGFALITPALMFRVQLHLALSGHWTVLAGLYLYARRDAPPFWMWPLLVGLTAAIHAYLLAMVLGLWAAALVERLWRHRARWNSALLEFVAGAGAAVVVMWAGGFFVTGTAATYGYGMYKLNLLGPLLIYRNWSGLMPDFPHDKYDYEGISFLGVGILFILVLCVLTGAVGILRQVVSRRWLPLVVVLILMAVFALSDDIYFADLHVVTLPLPQWAVDLASIFRSTGRFVWPLLYLSTIGIVVMFGRRLSALLAVPILLASFAVQALDSAPGLLIFSRALPPVSDTWTTPLTSPFWERAAAAGYKRVRVIPVISNPGTDWQALGYYAVTHRMGIDSVYLGRVDARALEALRAHEKQVLDTGDFEPETLYVLDPRSAGLAAVHKGPDDLLALIDKRIVFAKGGAHLVDGLTVAAPFAEP